MRESHPWRERAPAPLVGITADLDGGRLAVALAYVDAVSAAGGIPIVLPPLPTRVAEHAARCNAIVLTGGDDPRTEAFGVPTHPKTKPMDPRRQEYELALLAWLRTRQPEKPVLGICLGMQLMALDAGGKLDQHMPDTSPTAGEHWDAMHAIVPEAGLSPTGAAPAGLLIAPGRVASKHRQAVDDPGSLRIVARAHDGVIEAIADPTRPFYLGVQWHPERTADRELGAAIFERLVEHSIEPARHRPS